MNLPNIKTQQYTLKLLEVEKAQLLCDYYVRNKNHLKIWEPEREKSFYTLEFWQAHVQDSIDLFKSKQAVRLIALNVAEDKVIASCNFSNIVLGCFQAAHLGYSIDQDYEGKGIMFEVVKAGIDYINREFNLHRIMANHIPENKRSAQLLKRLDFEKEGYAKDYLKINGQWRDHILNALIL
jgi:ribosomal-protein-alanine N-acetyltransferase